MFYSEPGCGQAIKLELKYITIPLAENQLAISSGQLADA
jgi:hypothetical protein